jgi:tetratricopeptide (TPR) repeat protein
VRALIKLGEFASAETEIESLRQSNYLRESSFLNGLLQRHKGDTRSAIRSYEAALERGYRGMAIHRELAQCHLDLGEIPDAKHHAEQALRLGADNRYLIDLQIKIAVLERDEQSALSKLEMLKTVDRPEFYHHRASTVHLAFGRNTQALEHAQNAMAQVGRPTLAMLSQISMCEVRNGLLDEAAEHIRRMEAEFPNQHQDIRIGVKCLLETARHRYADALVLWNQLRHKERPVHLAQKRNILAGLLTGALPDALRAEYSRELGELNARLAGRLNAEFAMLDEDR